MPTGKEVHLFNLAVLFITDIFFKSNDGGITRVIWDV